MTDPAKLGQLDFAGMTKTEIAIARLQHLPKTLMGQGIQGRDDPLIVGFSGGKDSVALRHIALQADVPVEFVYNYTTMDPPELVHFVRSFSDVRMDHPRETMWQLIPRRGLPRRQGRWCCAELKERGGEGRIIVTGVRHAESKGRTRRSSRKVIEPCYNMAGKTYLNPIIDWDDFEVWEYLRNNDLEYCSIYDEGASGPYAGDGYFTRLGCVLCPMTREVDRQIERWPRIADAWKRATCRLWEQRGTVGTTRTTPEEFLRKYPTADVLWEWWIDRDASAPDDAQAVMFR